MLQKFALFGLRAEILQVLQLREFGLDGET